MTEKQKEAFARSDKRRAEQGLPPVRPERLPKEDEEQILSPDGIETRKISTPSRGLGDTVAKITDALHIKKCSACAKRQEFLNKLIPFDTNNNNNHGKGE